MIICITVLVIILSLPTVALAATTVQSYTNGGHTFTSDWVESKTLYYNGAKCVLTYGFDTTLINEDYAYAYTVGDIHRSKIYNSNGWHYGPWKYANYWSDQEVRHSGNSISYYQEWQ